MTQFAAARIESGNEALEFDVGKVPAHGGFALFQPLVRNRGKERLPVGVGDGLARGSQVEDGQNGIGFGGIEPELDTVGLLSAEIAGRKESQWADGRYHLFHAGSFSDQTPHLMNG